MKATYLYNHFRYDKECELVRVPVNIVGETDKSYKIQLLASNVRGHKYGAIIWAQKNSVVVPKQPRDCSNDFWNNY